MFARSVRDIFSTEAQLLSPLASYTLETWGRLLVWSIYACESEHARFRKLALGQGPGRNYAIMARQRFLDAAQEIHRQRMSEVSITMPGPGSAADGASGDADANEADNQLLRGITDVSLVATKSIEDQLASTLEIASAASVEPISAAEHRAMEEAFGAALDMPDEITGAVEAPRSVLHCSPLSW